MLSDGPDRRLQLFPAGATQRQIASTPPGCSPLASIVADRAVGSAAAVTGLTGLAAVPVCSRWPFPRCRRAMHARMAC
jgi:hypothetical protein